MLKKKNTEEKIETLAEIQIEMAQGVGKLFEKTAEAMNALSARIEKLENDNKLASGGGHTALWFFIVLLTIVNCVQIKLLLLSIWNCF